MDDDQRTPLRPRHRPCASCPYRRSVASGIWAASEYEKLPCYDGDVPEQLAHREQAVRVFTCHQSGQEVCSGWLAHREPGDLLAVRLGVSDGRLDPACLEHSTDVPLFASGRDAAEHGLRDVDAPDARARLAIDKITSVRSRTDHPLS